MTENKKFSLAAITAFLGKSTDLTLKFLKQWKIIFVYAAALTSISFVTGDWVYSCSTGENEWWCFTWNIHGAAAAVAWMAACLILVMYVLLSASYDIYETALTGKKFSLCKVFIPEKNKLVYSGIVVVSLISLFLPVFLAFVILRKPANPDYRVEFWYFLATFVFCWIPFIMLRIGIGISGFLEEKRLPSFRKVFEMTKGGVAGILFSYLLLFLIINLVQVKISVYLRAINFKWNYLVSAVGTEMISNILKIVYVMMAVAVLQALWDIFSGKITEKKTEEKNGQSVVLPDNETKDVKKSKKTKTAGGTAGRKNGKKKK